MTPRPRRRWVLAAALMAATAAGGMLLLGPAPPKRITLATGQPGGVYDAFGAQYRHRLEHVGLHITTVGSSGSLDNLARLLRGTSTSRSCKAEPIPSRWIQPPACVGSPRSTSSRCGC